MSFRGSGMNSNHPLPKNKKPRLLSYPKMVLPVNRKEIPSPSKFLFLAFTLPPSAGGDLGINRTYFPH